MYNLKPIFFGLLIITVSLCEAVCAQGGFAAYLGRPVSDLARRMGPPTSVVPGPNGWPIFQWSINATTGLVVEGLLIYRGQCTLEVAARPATSSLTWVTRNWIIDNWRFRGGGCIR